MSATRSSRVREATNEERRTNRPHTFWQTKGVPERIGYPCECSWGADHGDATSSDDENPAPAPDPPATGEGQRWGVMCSRWMMIPCEKCWADSAMARWTNGVEEYERLLKERDKTGGCTPEQQAGPDASECPTCHRMTLHQHCGVCMAGCAPPAEVKP